MGPKQMHSHGLEVVVWTFRNDDQHLSWDYGKDPYEEYQRYLDMGVDGFFTDFPGSLNGFFKVKELEAKLSISEVL